jgi:acyl-[acyl-carrier-protein] desaturase
MNNFAMPAIHDLLENSYQRIAAIKDLDIFGPDIYYRDVYLPLLRDLGITRAEMRTPPAERKSLRV